VATLADLQGFKIDAADVSLWLFKGPNGPSNLAPHYPGRWIETTTKVESVLRQTVQSEIARIEETIDYDLLAQNNEASILTIPRDETHADILTNTAAADAEARKVTDSGQLLNTKFYVIKFVHQGSILYAVRRTAAVWKTKPARAAYSIFYTENRLDVDTRPHFNLERSIDFIVYDDRVFIFHKGAFESVLRYKQAHLNDFTELQTDSEFVNAFVDTAPLVEHVGTNKIRLRRVSALRDKGHFRDADFMARLRERGAEFGFSIRFDNDGRIVATPETAAEILTALLDHRLASAFSQVIYDVQDSTPVKV
jgi:hypothetical protein